MIALVSARLHSLGSLNLNPRSMERHWNLRVGIGRLRQGTKMEDGTQTGTREGREIRARLWIGARERCAAVVTNRVSTQLIIARAARNRDEERTRTRKRYSQQTDTQPQRPLKV